MTEINVENGEDLTQPLLVNGAHSSVGGVPGEGNLQAHPSPDTPTDTHRPLSFFDNYEMLNGVPTYVLRPLAKEEPSGAWPSSGQGSSSGTNNSRARFTCHALSTDGSLLATGEDTGIIRVWCTTCYTCVRKIESAFADRISLSFYNRENNRIIAIGGPGIIRADRPNLQLFSFDVRQCGNDERNHRDAQNSVVASECTLPIDISQARRVQFSEDGTVFICRLKRPVQDGNEPHQMNQHSIFRIEADNPRIKLSNPVVLEEQTSIAIQEEATPGVRIALLSENGQSVIGLRRAVKERRTSAEISFDTPEVWIWPKISFDGSGVGNPVKIKRAMRARWGKSGEYALVWKRSDWEGPIENVEPILHVYKTSEIPQYAAGPPPEPEAYRTKSLNSGLVFWSAQFVDDAPEKEYPLLVAILEVYSLTKRRLILWDAENDCVVKEIPVDTRAGHKEARFNDVERRSLGINEGFTKDESKEIKYLLWCGELTANTEMRRYDWTIAHDMRPQCAISKDLSIACFFASSFTTVNISSLVSGVSMWDLILPSELKLNPFARITTCLLDKSGKRLLLMGREAVFAFAPPCLDMSGEKQLLTSEVPFSKSDHGSTQQFAKQMLRFPERALSKWIQNLLKTPGSDRTPDNQHEVIHSAISPDGKELALVTLKGDEYSVFRASSVEKSNRSEGRDVSDIFRTGKVDMNPQPSSSRYSFGPRLVYLHQFCVGENNKTVLLVMGKLTGNQSDDDGHDQSDDESKTHSARFYDSNDILLSHIELKMVHAYTKQSSDGGSVFVLSTPIDPAPSGHKSEVYVFDLKEQTQLEPIQYKASLEEALRQCDQSKWRRWMKPYSKIADAGTSILIAWDSENKRSIVATPDMSDEIVTKMIKDAEGHITSECILSPDAGWVTFVDPEELEEGRLTIGFYNNNDETVGRSVMLGHIPAVGDKSPTERIKSAKDVWFAVSEAGDELWKADWGTWDPCACQIVRATPYADCKCLPNYKRFSSQCNKPSNKNAHVKELFEKFGSCAFNMAHYPGMSLFQEALMKDDKVFEAIQSLAQEQGFSLSIDWREVKEGEQLTDLHPLCEKLFPKQRTDMQKMLKAVLHGSVCYNRCSAAIGEGFDRVYSNVPRIIELLIRDSKLIVDLCELDVHPEFFSQKHHPGLHIETSNTTLEWSLTEDRESRNRIWRKLHKDLIKTMEKHGEKSTVKAALKMVRVADVAKLGMEGILQKLLLKNAPINMFIFDTVKWTIHEKWKRISHRQRWVRVGRYTVFAVFFSVYAAMISYDGPVNAWQTVHGGIVFLPLVICWFAALWILVEELNRLRALFKTGKEDHGSSWTGFNHHRRVWSGMQLTPSLIAFVVVPGLYISALCGGGRHVEDALHTVVALESIFVWLKMCHYLVAFKPTGAVILTLYEIAKDALRFLFLVAMMLLGFSLAFFNIFKTLPSNADTGDYKQTVDEDFRTFPRSLRTLFNALFADFPDELYNPSWGWSIVVNVGLCVYVILQAVLLLNLLIAIMGDTFNKVKNSEESHLLKGRAEYIDLCEASLTDDQTKEMNKEFGTYLLALVPLEHDLLTDTGEWHGPLDAIKRMIDTSGRKADRGREFDQEASKERFDELEKRVEKLQTTLDNFAELQATLDNFAELQATLDNFAELQATIDSRIEELDRKRTAETHELKGMLSDIAKNLGERPS